jgi:vancomycin resistance protein YoaR
MVELALRQAKADEQARGQRPAREGADTKQRSCSGGPWRAIAISAFAAAEIAGLVIGGAWALGVLGRAHLHAHNAEAVVPGVTVAGYDVGGLSGNDLEAVALAAGLAATAQPMTLVAGTAEVETSRFELGAEPDPSGAIEAALAVGRSGNPLRDIADRLGAGRGEFDFAVSHRFHEPRAIERLLDLQPDVETPSLPTRLDFDARKVIPAQRGTALLAYDSMSAIATGLAMGADRIELVVQDKPPVEDPLADVAATLDISIVLGSFDTPYQTDQTAADRTHNLKVGAAALDGTVLMPGEEFSFNTVVGDRTAEQGYRYATGIEAGQLVDVVGGGICQVSSTLFGAAFFGGLGVVQAVPHSRPSDYVDMGLDSTVVYGSLDMKLRNDYDFPVVLHMTVSQGKVHAEVLGPRRPYQVTFERRLEEVRPFNTVWRDDPKLRSGTETLVQRGRRGFKLQRQRKFLQGGAVVKTESWDLEYPSTTEIHKRGTSPTGEVPEDKPLPMLREPAPSLQITQ